jgi:predicted PP-loop superfamily ATPase
VDDEAKILRCNGQNFKEKSEATVKILGTAKGQVDKEKSKRIIRWLGTRSREITYQSFGLDKNKRKRRSRFLLFL